MQSTITSKIVRYRILFVAAFLVFVLDQITKAWIFFNLDLDSYNPPDSIALIDGFFYIVHIGNEGAAWGMLSGYGGLLAVFALIALFAIYLLRDTLELHRKSMQYAFGLLAGGILGNMSDRLVHGHVIDFLDFHFPFTIPWLIPTGRYPSFNIADCGIVIGTILYLILSVKIEAKKDG
jgi:signal peptidase II